MVARRPIDRSSGITGDQRRNLALKSAIMLRDCSFRERSASDERHACRNLMRREAIKWRRAAVGVASRASNGSRLATPALNLTTFRS